MDKPTLVIGASDNPTRYSNKAINLLRKHAHMVYAIGVRQAQVADVAIQQGFPHTFEPPVHTVTVYLRPDLQSTYFEYLTNLRPARIIANPGTENPALMQLAHTIGAEYEEACTLVLLNTNQY
jgi:predicted CoA-binding protein